VMRNGFEVILKTIADLYIINMKGFYV